MRYAPKCIIVGGHTLLLRSAQPKDAEMLIDYLKITAAETRFLLCEPQEITYTAKEERAFIKAYEKNDRALLLLAFCDGTYIGNCSFIAGTRLRQRHRATVGIALFREYTGRGFGRAMLRALEEAAAGAGIEQLELDVVADNARAIHLYESLGYVRHGLFPRQMKYTDGTYADGIFMLKIL